MTPNAVVLVTKIIKNDDLTAKEHIVKTVYGMSGYPYGVLSEVRTTPEGEQEFWVVNTYGLVQISYFCLCPE